MPTWGESYVREFNQLVEVYDPEGIEPIEVVTDRDDVDPTERREEIEAIRDRVGALEPDDLFSEAERATIADEDDLPAVAEVAADRRAELDQRLRQTSEALAAAGGIGGESTEGREATR